jgi:hypothetical protein
MNRTEGRENKNIQIKKKEEIKGRKKKKWTNMKR